MAIAAQHERHLRRMRGLPSVAATEDAESSEQGGGESTQEDRMNELAAEKRNRRTKEASIKPYSTLALIVSIVASTVV